MSNKMQPRMTWKYMPQILKTWIQKIKQQEII